MLAAGLSRFTQIEEDPRGAIDAMTRDEGRADQAQQPGVLLGVVRDRLLEPVIVTAHGHLEDATHLLHAVPISIGFDEFVRRTDPSRDLVLGLRDCSSAKSGMLASVTKSLELQIGLPTTTPSHLPPPRPA